MPLSFPLSLDDFFGGLKVSQMRLMLDQPRRVTATRGGEQWDASLGDPRWRGELTLRVDHHADQSAFEAVLDLAASPGATFLAYDKRFIGPRDDPDGGPVANLANRNLRLESIATDRATVVIRRLPLGFVLHRGDLVGVTAASGQLGLFRVVVPGTTAFGVDYNLTEVGLHPRLGAAFSADDAVTLIRPQIKAKLTGLETGVAARNITAGATLDFVQVLS